RFRLGSAVIRRRQTSVSRRCDSLALAAARRVQGIRVLSSEPEIPTDPHEFEPLYQGVPSSTVVALNTVSKLSRVPRFLVRHNARMPSYAHLVTTAACPKCGSHLDVPHDLIAFQWGYCPSRQPWDQLFYSIGDEIRWRLDDDDEIRPWVYFKGAQQAGNIGDPTVQDLIVRGYDAGGNHIRCTRCSVEGMALRIERGRIVSLQEAVAGCDVAVLEDAQSITPRPEWDDAPMPDSLEVRNRKLATSAGRAIIGKLAPP
ncbi:MAG: hypothetical protein ACXVJ3_19850, partial [Ilumatobacteraceae bacterium]